MPNSNEKRGASRDKRNATPDESPAAQAALVVDAGAAPVELIKRARPLSVDVTAIDAGPPRISAAQLRAEPNVPLNPLRAGAAIATGVKRRETAPQIDDAVAPADIEGGGAPKPPVGKKQSSRTRNAKARLTRPEKGKR
jgi:hypothetical protein